MSDIDKFENLKHRAEFFKKGTIVPQRILRGPRKQKHRITFGSDSYAVPTMTGYLIIALCGETGSALVMNYRTRNAQFFGSPYTPKGSTAWFGNCHLSDGEYASSVLRQLENMNRRTA